MDTAAIRAALTDQIAALDLDQLERVCDAIESSGHEAEFRVGLLRILEAHPEAEFGTPGALVHTLERGFGSGYEAELMASLDRRPTWHTVWMLNRLINGTKGVERARYVERMSQLANEPAVDAAVRDRAVDFLT